MSYPPTADDGSVWHGVPLPIAGGKVTACMKRGCTVSWGPDRPDDLEAQMVAHFQAHGWTLLQEQPEPKLESGPHTVRISLFMADDKTAMDVILNYAGPDKR